jgi:hypothetical protein
LFDPWDRHPSVDGLLKRTHLAFDLAFNSSDPILQMTSHRGSFPFGVANRQLGGNLSWQQRNGRETKEWDDTKREPLGAPRIV